MYAALIELTIDPARRLPQPLLHKRSRAISASSEESASHLEPAMLKFVVVLYRRPDLSPEAFFSNLRDEHGPLAERIPGLRRYVQNHVVPDPRREHPGWDAVIELYWDDWDAMEAAWASSEGQAATDHLRTLADLSRTTWSVVRAHVRR
jgi:uncharacterized protein (TIGR02118 family)